MWWCSRWKPGFTWSSQIYSFLSKGTFTQRAATPQSLTSQAAVIQDVAKWLAALTLAVAWRGVNHMRTMDSGRESIWSASASTRWTDSSPSLKFSIAKPSAAWKDFFFCGRIFSVGNATPVFQHLSLISPSCHADFLPHRKYPSTMLKTKWSTPNTWLLSRRENFFFWQNTRNLSGTKMVLWIRTWSPV